LFFFVSFKKKKIDEIKNKKTKNKKNVLELSMTSIPLRHALLGIALRGNIATGKACSQNE